MTDSSKIKDETKEIELKKFTLNHDPSVITEDSLLLLSDINEFILGDKITGIREKAFYKNTNLYRLNIPKTVAFIKDYAFSFSSLHECIIPDTTTIGDIFCSCQNLFNVRFPANIETLYAGGISCLNCKLPKHLEKIVRSTLKGSNIHGFYGDVYIPKSLKIIEGAYFKSCAVHYEGNKEQFNKLVKDNYLDTGGIISIEYNCDYAYESYEDWPRYKFEQIGDCVIYNNILCSCSTKDTNIVIPDNVRWIAPGYDKEYYKKCPKIYKGDNVETFNIPDSLMEIPSYFFLSFPSLDYMSLHLIDKFKKLNLGIDYEYGNIDVYESNIHPKELIESDRLLLNTKAPVLAFENKNEYVSCTYPIEKTNLQYISTSNYCGESLEIGNNYHIHTLILENNVKKLVFTGEECIKNLYIPEDFNYIAWYFDTRSVIHIENVYFGGNEERWKEVIGDINKSYSRKGSACYIEIDNIYYNSYSKSKDFTISKLKEIEEKIGLNPVISKDPIIPIINYEDVFNKKRNNNEKIMDGSYDVDKGEYVAPPKQEFEYVVPSDKKKIEDDEYLNSKIKSIYIPSTCKTIGNYAFSKCKNLKKVYLEDGIKSIGTGAFENCESLESVEIPATIETIPMYAFNGCSKLEEVIFRGNTKRIMRGAFNSTAIGEFYYPEGIEHIDGNAFIMSDLTYVHFPKSVKFIEANACKSRGFDDTVEVFFDGTDDEWNQITIKRPNDQILNNKPQKRKKKAITSKHGKNNVKIKVTFDDGKSYYYNCQYGVEVGDDVKVEGSRSKEIGHVVEIVGPWDKYNKYMKEVIKVIPK